MEYLLNFRLADGLLALEDCNCVQLSDVLVLIGGLKPLNGLLDDFLLAVRVDSGEHEAGSSPHLEVLRIFTLAGWGDADQHQNKEQAGPLHYVN